MSTYEKVVKLACKPKAAPPKAKYLDTILAATWSEDGAVHDVCKALSPRFREPNAIVVFKALIVLHTMIRNGATDNVLAYLSTSEVLRLRNVSAGNWEGYNAPQNLQLYAIYLDSRIRAYRDLKHDAVRVQAESNRDMRNISNIEEDMAYRGERPAGKGGQPTRSKTLMGRKLRVMAVEKGLLRETKAVQRMIDSLVECRFYLDDLGDELTITALRMLVKDLLILFQAGNEGVINVLEHYFEMSKIDAQSALDIYRHFCKQTERVVEYLSVATKLQNLLNVPIPNLKHAPVSLAGALEEYLNDPNFEQNRIEYKANKLVAEKNSNGAPASASAAGGSSSSSSATSKPATKVSFAEVKKPERSASMPMKLSVNPAAAAEKPETNQAMQDFFSAIEEEQPTMFNPQTGSPNPNYFQQQATSNPFGSNPFGAFAAQPTGTQQPAAFMMPQQTAFQQPLQPNAFGLQPPQEQQHRPFHSFLQPQNTGFLQPQPTGSNPFRQSMFVMQPTGVSSSPFGMGNQPSPFQQQGQNMAAPAQAGPSPFITSPFPTAGPSAFSSVTPLANSPFSQNFAAPAVPDLPARPASTPLTSFGLSAQSSSTSPPAAQPVKAHQTGSRNPFGIPVAPAPPVPKAPTLMELAMGGSSTNSSTTGQQTGINGTQPQQHQQTGSFGGANAFGTFGSGGGDGKGNMASVASSFSFKNTTIDETTSGLPAVPNASGALLNTQNTATTGSGFSDSLFSTSNSQPTGATSPSSPSSISISPGLKPQTTGFSGLKAFKPSSSFGASLLESLPPITMPNSNSTGTAGGASPAAAAVSSPGGMTSFGAVASGLSSQPTRMNSQPTGAPSFGGFGGGSTLGVGLRPQMTGAANPFRASMFTGSMGGPMSATTGAFSSSTSSPSAFTGATGNFNAGLSASNGTPFGAFGSGLNPNSGDLSKQQQQPQQIGSASLI